MAPKATIKQEKKDYIAGLADRMAGAKSAVFVEYTGMGVKTQQDFKANLREVGGSMIVAKNTLIRLAAQKAGYPEDALGDSTLSGQTAVVFSGEDAVASIQVLGKFAKDNELPKIKSGVVEGLYQDEAGVVKISRLPSKEQLQANVVGAIGAPLYSTVSVLQANLQKLVFVLDQARQKSS